MSTIDLTREVISRDQIEDWLADYPWLTGYLGNPLAPVWFVGENPSKSRVKLVGRQSNQETENLQWSYDMRECRLFRDALTEAGLKHGNPAVNEGWQCYVTNAVKEPDIVGERNRKRSSKTHLQKEALRWLGVLQYQIESGRPKVLIAIGGRAERILRYMKSAGLNCPIIEKIPHYSYIMLRPERKTKRGPGHIDRQVEFKRIIKELARKYGS